MLNSCDYIKQSGQNNISPTHDKTWNNHVGPPFNTSATSSIN